MYEVGALAALEERLNGEGRGFDIYVGCSAGSVVAAFLAGGIRASELYRIVDEDLEDPLNFRRVALFRSAPLGQTIRRACGRLWALGRDAVALVRNAVSEHPPRMVAGPPAGFFSLEALEQFVRKGLASRSIANSFADLPRTLLIPAVDLDRGQRTVFGLGERR